MLCLTSLMAGNGSVDDPLTYSVGRWTWIPPVSLSLLLSPVLVALYILNFLSLFLSLIISLKGVVSLS